MIRDHLLTLYRSLSRHRLYAALNIGGLAVGIAVFLVLMLTVRFETSFNRWLPGVEEIQRVNITYNFPGRTSEYGSNMQGVVLPLLLEDYPQITAGTRVKGHEAIVRQGAQSTREDISLVDPSFFDVFELPLVAGDAASALADPTHLVLSETLARKYFGDRPAAGQFLNLSINGTERRHRVAAVMRDLPASSSLDIGMLGQLSPSFFDEGNKGEVFEEWSSSTLSTYLRFANPAQASVVRDDLGSFIARRAPPDVLPTPDFVEYDLMPLTDVHFADALDPTAKRSADPAVVATLGVVGLMTLLIAAINYVNLATARAGLRAREVALRKVLGGTRRALALQFLTEAVTLAAVAALLGLALTELALPVINAFGGTALELRYFGPDGVLIWLALLALVTGLCAGVYPALMLSNFAPASVLASARAPGGGRAGARVREALVAFQFAVALAFTICTAVMLAQADHVRRADLGFEREGLLVIEDFMDAELDGGRQALLAAFRTIPGVVAATTSNRSPATGNVSTTNAARPGHVGQEPTLVWEMVGPGYFETYGVELAAGRAFNAANRLDDVRGTEQDINGRNVMLNEAAVEMLGFASPQAAIGQTVRYGRQATTVIGVTRDVRFRSPREPIPALLLMFNSGDVPRPVAAVRFRGDPQAVVAGLGREWRRVAPNLPFEAQTVDQLLSDYYEPEERRSRLFTLGAFIAIAIGAVGLYGLASFTAARRTKEIGIRKTLGASTTDVLRLLVGQFLRPVLLAGVVAWPVAFVLMQGWLDRFDQRIELNPLYFVLPTLLALALAVLTVVGQALRVARAEPARALRYE